MEHIEIRKLTRLHELGVKWGISCGVSTEKDAQHIANLCADEFERLDRAKAQLGEAKVS